MTTHRISSYKDGWRKIDFCTICGAEGEELLVECVGIENKLKEREKDIDTPTERN